MTRVQVGTCYCAKCGHNFEQEIYSSVNSNDEELYSSILDRQFFIFSCPKCKVKQEVPHELLFNNTINNYMIYLLPEYTEGHDERDDMVKSLRSQQHKMFGSNSNTRIVTTIKDLIEKIMIFDICLDDRIIEIYKDYIENNVKEKLGISEVKNIFFSSAGDSNAIVFVIIDKNGEMYQLEFSYARYFNILNHYDKKIAKYQKKHDMAFSQIDKKWARDFLKKEQ